MVAAFVYSSAGPVPLPDQPGTSQDRATQLALGLYVAYKLAATVASVLAGRLGDRRGAVLILAPSGSAVRAGLCWLRRRPTSVLALAPGSWPPGSPSGVWGRPSTPPWLPWLGRAAGVGVRAAGGGAELRHLAASAIAGLLWTAASPRAAFTYLVAWMLLALAGLLAAGRAR
jgi:hypothetical protein